MVLKEVDIVLIGFFHFEPLQKGRYHQFHIGVDIFFDLPFFYLNLGYDFSQGYTSLERSTQSLDEKAQSPISQWLEQRRQARQRREEQQEADEERRVDEILARLHEHGLRNLSDEDRSILERVSARYRNRMGGS